MSSTKRQKMVISRSIVETVRTLDPPGRFLDKDPETGLWFDIGHKRAVEKTSQALRDGAATLKKQLSDDLDDPEFLNGLFKEDDGAQNGDEEGKQNRVEKEEDGSEKADDKEKKDAKVKASEKLTPAKVRVVCSCGGTLRTVCFSLVISPFIRRQSFTMTTDQDFYGEEGASTSEIKSFDLAE